MTPLTPLTLLGFLCREGEAGETHAPPPLKLWRTGDERGTGRRREDARRWASALADANLGLALERACTLHRTGL
jgi:hypothetical protein